ncbi:putative RNA recognition motif domain, nucleotide-binding alpha-beta plait domain superfamily [Helianthus annuus]|nr:putative RNA recognition motif domain, nucleotide-binding alpha-beta plait domain superfamily [Helianthus annuus]
MDRRGRGGIETRRWKIKEKVAGNNNQTEDDEEWERVKKKKGKEKIDDEPSTTIFIANLPEDVSRKEIWLECRRCGNITDVYLPFKKDLKGKRFAFVRFNKFRDLEKLIQALNNVWIGEKKLKANVSKFEREDIYDGKGDRKEYGNTGGMYKNMNWAKRQENLNRNSANQYWNSANQKPAMHIGGNDGNNIGKGRSYLDAVKGVRRQEDLVSVVLPDDSMNDMGDWNKRTFLLEAKSIENLCRAKIILNEICSHSMEVRYAGGLSILITVGSQMVAEEIMTTYKKQIEEFFTQVIFWKEDMVRYERLAWIRVCGVPISLRKKETFNAIGGYLGKVVKEADATTEDNNLTSAHLGVIVNTGKVFNDEILAQYKTTTFKCWVSEVSGNWAPKFVEDVSPFINIPDEAHEIFGENEEEMHDDDRNSNSSPDGGSNEIPAEGEVETEEMEGQDNEEPHRKENKEAAALNFG